MYSMKQTCELTNLSYQTLKYYCNEGLIPNVKRDENNYRIFDDNNIAWIKSLSCLKNCGMSILEMKKYLALCLKGESSIPERQVILEHKKEDLEKRKQEIQASLDFIEWKQGLYNDFLSGKTKYYSYLVSVEDDKK